MSKLGYTWYPKDWTNSESVFELSLSERGLYRELIDLAMLNDNKTEVKIKIWSRKFGENSEKIEKILKKLEELSLIKITHNKLFIPSCEPRLQLKRGGSNGGKKSKPTPKPNDKPTPKPTPNQRERENKREIKRKGVEWKNRLCKSLDISAKEFEKHLPEFTGMLDLKEDWDRPLSDIKSHLYNWLRKQDLNNLSDLIVTDNSPVN